MKKLKPGALSWALYDCANSAFALIVLTAIYPPFFNNYYAAGAEESDVIFIRSIVVSGVGFVVALLAPFLGAIGDHGGGRVRFLAVAMGLGVAGTAALIFAGEGQWVQASVYFSLGSIGFYCGNIFYDSLIVQVTGDEDRHFVSALGFSIGYLGSVLLLIGIVVWLGARGREGVDVFPIKTAFALTALWWALFSIPILRNVREPDATARPKTREAMRRGLAELKRVGRAVIKNRSLLFFLLAYWFYIDGTNTVIHMGGTYAETIGFGMQDLLATIILIQIVGVPFALLFGWLGQRVGARPMILAGIAVYIGVTIYASQMSIEPLSVFGLEVKMIYIMGLLIGMAQGGLQSLSRSYFASLIPPSEAAAYFGFYNMVGKAAAILGPLLMGVVAKTMDSPSASILSISVLFIVGAILLLLARPDPAEA